MPRSASSFGRTSLDELEGCELEGWFSGGLGDFGRAFDFLAVYLGFGVDVGSRFTGDRGSSVGSTDSRGEVGAYDGDR